MSELLVSIPKEERLIIIATEKYIGVDIHIPVLERMYHKQLTGYAQIRYKTLSSKNEPDKISIIYDSDTFVSAIKMTLQKKI